MSDLCDGDDRGVLIDAVVAVALDDLDEDRLDIDGVLGGVALAAWNEGRASADPRS